MGQQGVRESNPRIASKKLRESNLSTSDQRQHAKPLSYSLFSTYYIHHQVRNNYLNNSKGIVEFIAIQNGANEEDWKFPTVFNL